MELFLSHPLDQLARIPAHGDNVAIATRRIESGTTIDHGGHRFTLAHTVLEGHRFAHQPISTGGPLLSWSLPFGTALRPIDAGAYVCNDRILRVLAGRQIDAELPCEPNFADHDRPYRPDDKALVLGTQVERHTESAFFDGFARGTRGVGTRNFVVVMGTSSLTATYAKTLAARFVDVSGRFANIDGVAAVAHTEGGEDAPNNLNFVLRALSGFMVHPNVAAILTVDHGDEAVNNAMLRSFMSEREYGLDGPDAPPHAFLSLAELGGLDAALDAGAAILERWLEPANAARRSGQSVKHLKLALQCGGSDAFSGVSSNPLAGWVAKQTIQYGGSANLAETDELIGAEPYVLANVRDVATAHAFLEKVDVFKQRAARHGHSAEGNPSGGNLLRGLYNIAIKSIGAARKKDPQVRLDFVIDYGQPMREPGYYFMDSPGNDLESVAGQVASGSNLILFTTGNGSITNFPFVPTIKIVTTTGRYELVRRDMDVNAGRYQDGTPMEQLGTETFDKALQIAGGRRSVGEKAGHAQVQLWRNWRQNKPISLQQFQATAKPSGRPTPIKDAPRSAATFTAYRTSDGYACDRVGAVAPTSLCSGQIAHLIVERLNNAQPPRRAVSRFVTFAHTEGCGVSGGGDETLYLRTLIGHAAHPMVHQSLLLEHGCEKTHNDVMRQFLIDEGLEPSSFGWASVQLDGGIESVTDKVAAWFDQASSANAADDAHEVGLEHLRLGIASQGALPNADTAAAGLAQVAAAVVASGGTVVVPANASLMGCSAFRDHLFETADLEPSLSYGQRATQRGFHLMDTPTDHACETLTGLGATGVDLMVARVASRPLQAHPMVPLVQVANAGDVPDADLHVEPNARDTALADDLMDLLLRVASRLETPKLFGRGYTDFQMTRGLLGVSL